MFELLFFQFLKSSQGLVKVDSHFLPFSQKLSWFDEKFLQRDFLDIFNKIIELAIQEVEFVLIYEYLERLYQIFPEGIDIFLGRIW